MKALQTAQCFDAVAGMPRFLYTKVIYRFEDELYCSRIFRRIPSGSKEIDPEELTDTVHIPIEAYCPQYTTDMTRAPNPLPPNCYVKRPNMIAYEQGLDQLVLQDIHACEKLKRHPHRNIASYYGCEVSDGRVVGLCFKAYRDTLMERMNPGHLNKQQCSRWNPTAAARYLPAIRNGISHIHSLRYAHNDITPHNIMFDDDDSPILTDFDSCLPFESSLATAKRTPGWYDPDILTSDPKNDWDAVSEIEVWLNGSPKGFKFQGF